MEGQFAGDWQTMEFISLIYSSLRQSMVPSHEQNQSHHKKYYRNNQCSVQKSSYTHRYNTVGFLHRNKINHIITSTIATMNAQFRRATRENTYNSVKRVLERYWHKQNQRWFEEDFGDCLTECHPWSHLCSAAESLSVSSVLLVSDAPCWTLLTQHNPKVSILTPPSERPSWSTHPNTHTHAQTIQIT